jgi:succinoglycan biosynthesis protein ExoM
MTVSLCIATFRRPSRLHALLGDLTKQLLLPAEVIVVDNDANGSARKIVDQLRKSGLPFKLHYEIQPVRNISLTRNRTVQLAQGDWIAFIDDDERAPANWLTGLVSATEKHGADGALGPVQPGVPRFAPAWIRRGTFYDWARMATGTVVPPNQLRFGNVLLRADLLRQESGPFDPAYGLTGGEDGDLLSRLVQGGARIVWCDEAVVHEPIETARLSLRWLMLRSLRGGQDFARHRLNGRFGPMNHWRRASFFVGAMARFAGAIALAAVLCPRGRHRCAHWLLKAAANIGKLSVFMGLHYREYGGTPK